MISPVETWIIVGLFIGHSVEGKTFQSEEQCIEYSQFLTDVWKKNDTYDSVLMMMCRRK